MQWPKINILNVYPVNSSRLNWVDYLSKFACCFRQVFCFIILHIHAVRGIFHRAQRDFPFTCSWTQIPLDEIIFSVPLVNSITTNKQARSWRKHHEWHASQRAVARGVMEQMMSLPGQLAFYCKWMVGKMKVKGWLMKIALSLTCLFINLLNIHFTNNRSVVWTSQGLPFMAVIETAFEISDKAFHILSHRK